MRLRKILEGAREDPEAYALGAIGAAQGFYKYYLRPERTHNETHHGTLGWLAIGAFVVAFDLLSEESLTHAFRRGLDNPRSRNLVLGGLAVTAAHLMGVLPKEVDPYYLLLHREATS